MKENTLLLTPFYSENILLPPIKAKKMYQEISQYRNELSSFV